MVLFVTACLALLTQSARCFSPPFSQVVGGNSADRHQLSTRLFAAPVDVYSASAASNGRHPFSLAETDAETDTFNWTQQWYPVAPLSQLDSGNGKPPATPQACTVLGNNIVLWKSGANDDGTPIFSALDDTCPHRKVPLSSGGRIVDGNGSCSSSKNLACRMHGWEFDGDGSCVKIPMMEGGSLTDANKRSLGTLSYPVKSAGGLVWVFLDPTVPHDALPEIPHNAAVPDEELEDKFWVHSLYMSPVSFESQIENSFDPSHAPFVHQSIGASGGFGSYSPDNAIPMQRYQVVEGIDVTNGFAVEHTPYQNSGKHNSGGPENAITMRRFIPPCTQITTSPDGADSRLQFVPQNKRETRVTFSFGIPKPKTAILRRIMQFALNNDFLHTLTEMSESRRRFADQDRIIMQGQDERKMLNGRPWADLKPSKSDIGVATFQQWMSKFGRGGPFANVAATPNVGALSMWESHGQHCARCKRTLKGLTSLEKRAARTSRVSVFLGISSGIASIIMMRAKASHVGVCLSSTLFLFVLSFVSHSLASWSARFQGKMIAVDLTKRQSEEVYVY